MLETLATAELLALYPAIRDAPPALREAVVRDAQVLAVPAGAVLFDDGAACEGFPLVLSGSVKVSKGTASGRELQLYRVGAGESCILTSSCLLGGAHYSARGVADAPTRLAVLPRPLFLRLMAESEAFRVYMFGLFSERMLELMTLVEAVAFQRLDRRLAALLLGRGKVVAATHQAIADELGSVREIVTRLLRAFAEQGLVALGRERIEILDAAGLRDLADGEASPGARPAR
jgi:CRP/FNR family transcriptional regulator